MSIHRSRDSKTEPVRPELSDGTPAEHAPHASPADDKPDVAHDPETGTVPIHELQEHEFTLELEPDEGIMGWTDEHTARWSRQQPVPAWATTARALLEETGIHEIGLAAADAVPVESPTRKTELVSCSISELRALRDALDSAQSAAQARALEVTRLTSLLADAQSDLKERDRQLAQHTAQQLGLMRGQAFRIAELEAALREHDVTVRSNTPQRVARKRVAKHDDLTVIRGIGPRFAQRLPTLDAGTYASIAAWTAADVIRVAEALSIGVKRIRSEGWIRQARKLQQKQLKAR